MVSVEHTGRPESGEVEQGAFAKLDNPKKERMLRHYVNLAGQVYRAARFTGISPQTHYNWLQADPDYAAAFQEARQRSLDVIEQEIVRRGVKGYKEPIVYQGKITGYVRRFSDNLLMFRAKRLDPAYRDTYPVGLAVGGDVNVTLQIPRPDGSPMEQAPVIDAEAREMGQKPVDNSPSG